MRVPDLQIPWQGVEESALGTFYAKRSLAIFPFLAALDFALQKTGHHLQSEADAENGDAKFENRLVWQWGILGVNAGRTPGEYNPASVHFRDDGGGRVVVDNG